MNDGSKEPQLILVNAKSVSLWQARISKIDESYFWNKILHEKVPVRDITQNGPKSECDNLGHSRIEKWIININFLIRPIHPQFNSGCTGPIRKFNVSNFCRDLWNPNSPNGTSNLSRGYLNSLLNSPDHQDRWSEQSITVVGLVQMHEHNVEPN